MAYSFDSFKVEIIDRPFVRSDGFSTKQTAKLELFNSKGGLITTLNLGVPDLSEVYESIGQMKPVNLDFCYIYGFSTLACKRYLQIDKSQPIPIAGFSAKNSFFHSSISVDFSFAHFSGDFIIDESYIVAELLDFHLSSYGTQFRLTNSYIKASKANVTQVRFEGERASFKNSTFDEGFKDFQDSFFGANEVIFTNVEFSSGDVSFINTEFNSQDVDFRVSRFGVGKVDFHYARFGNSGVSFERVDFGSGRVDFRAVEFGAGRTSFNRSTFIDGEINFEGAEVQKGKLSLKRVDFGNSYLIFDLYQGFGTEVLFERSTFNNSVSFSEAKIGKLLFRECQFNASVNLHVQKCDEISLTGCTIRDIFEFYTHGTPPEIKSLNLAGVRLLGQLYIDWNANQVSNLIYSQAETSIVEKAEQFRILKENFNALGRYDEEDKAYVEFKRCELKSSREKVTGNLLQRITNATYYFLKKLLFDYMGLYATSPKRVLISIFFIYLFYSFLYILIMVSGVGHVVASSSAVDSLGLVPRAFYFSVVTFFTIGYGDFSPDGFARIIAGSEGFMGVFLMAYFTVAFVRKILR